MEISPYPECKKTEGKNLTDCTNDQTSSEAERIDEAVRYLNINKIEESKPKYSWNVY